MPSSALHAQPAEHGSLELGGLHVGAEKEPAGPTHSPLAPSSYLEATPEGKDPRGLHVWLIP